MKKVKIYFGILLIALTIYMAITLIQSSYALFETNGSAVLEQDVAKWKITVNNIGVTGATKEFVVDNFNYETSEYINDNKIAPGGSCYFDIVIDATNTDVSVKYVIDFDFTLISNYDFIKTEVIDLTDGDVIKTNINEYTGVLDIEQIKEGQSKTLRVKLTWDNNEENNEKDSELGLDENAELSIPVIVKLTQYTSETIVPYNE